MFKPKKPTPEEIVTARNALGAEIEKLSLGDGSTTAERVKKMADAYLEMMKRAEKN